ncbi:LPS-assembly protein LptD [Acidithiobacillus sp. M4-SHS-6]|uniref:LPS-assembly protein LptD n=1 Tax=Acidithiobacillus sp. M4-SHS-6 TaxID=3383024 RepID=UPI0039BE0C63
MKSPFQQLRDFRHGSPLPSGRNAAPRRRIYLALLAVLLSPGLAWAAVEQPITLYADKVNGLGSGHWTATGNVEVLYGDRRVYADTVHYNQRKDEILADGHVRMVSPGLVTAAPQATIHLKANEGVVVHPRYLLEAEQGHGHAESGRELSKGHYQLNEACYTTCHGKVPAWRLWSSQLDLNQNDNYVTTRNTILNVSGVPVFWMPYFSFPLKRHSGFLAPGVGSSTINGFYLGIPYYFDIARNLDDTFTLNYFTRRGVMLQNEFRYLEPNYSGRLFLDLLPSDQLTHKNVWAISWQHNQNLGDGFSFNVDYNRVSYKNFLSDFGSTAGFGSSFIGGIGNAPYITSTGGIYYNNAHISAGAVLQGYQELAPNSSAPYSQLPRLYADGYWRVGRNGYFNWHSSFNYFSATTGPIGQRLDLTPTLGWRFSRGWGFLEPQARLYYSHYQIQRNASYARATNRTLPALSLKGGLNFVRYGSNGSTALLQPIFKYTYIPLQAQNDIPNFDASAPYLDFPSIFTDNVLYSGSDRINAANQIAYGLRGTWLTPSGRQLWEVAVGQIRYFNQRQINLAGDIVPQAVQSNYFFEGQYAPLADMNLLASSQVNPQSDQLDRLNLRAQWLPGPQRVINLDYRFTRDFVDQTGVSAAWPVFRNWQLLGSYQYDVTDRKPLEELVGIGYDGGCWAAHMMVYHQILLGGQSNNAIYFEIVLRGLTSLGNASTGLLSQYVPGASMEF